MAVGAVERARQLLLRPAAAWAAIEAEAPNVQDLYTRYVMILAAIPPLALFVGGCIVGVGGLGTYYRVPLAPGLAAAVLGWALTLASVFAMALVIDALAPAFGGERNFTRAMQVASYSPTAFWVAGALHVVPVLGLFSVAGLYSLWLLWLGLPRLMRIPEDKAVPCLIVVMVAGVVAMAATWTVAGLVLPSRVRGF